MSPFISIGFIAARAALAAACVVLLSVPAERQLPVRLRDAGSDSVVGAPPRDEAAPPTHLHGQQSVGTLSLRHVPHSHPIGLSSEGQPQDSMGRQWTGEAPAHHSP